MGVAQKFETIEKLKEFQCQNHKVLKKKRRRLVPSSQNKKGNLDCPSCGDRFHVAKYKSHSLVCERKDKRTRCKECNKLIGLDGLLPHIIRCQSPSLREMCEVCSKFYPAFTKHRCCGEKKYLLCQVCKSRSFKSSDKLKTHVAFCKKRNARKITNKKGELKYDAQKVKCYRCGTELGRKNLAEHVKTKKCREGRLNPLATDDEIYEKVGMTRSKVEKVNCFRCGDEVAKCQLAAHVKKESCGRTDVHITDQEAFSKTEEKYKLKVSVPKGNKCSR